MQILEEIKDHLYQKELFERLRKSPAFKREEECFGTIIRPAFWWIIEKPDPRIADVSRIIAPECPCIKKTSRAKSTRCASILLSEIKKCARTKAIATFDCPKSALSGFAYPVVHGDKIYGYLGACYNRKDVSAQILAVFAAFTDTIVREIEKELELAKLYETVRPRAIALSTVHTVHRLISSTLDLNELLPRIARLSLQIMRSNRCSIKLIDAKRKVLLPKSTVDLRSKKIHLKKVRVGKWAPGKAVKFGRPIRGDDFLATPLIDDDVIGVITLYDKIDQKPFSAFDQEIMSTLAEQAVIAIKNAQLYKEQERLTMGTIKSLATILDALAPGTYVPQASFIKIAVSIGQELHLDSEALKNLEYAAILHDAGEIFVPDRVLSKPEKLTGEEYEMVKEHPIIGVEIIKHMKALKSVVPIILYHHEKFDGTGYPKGLKKDQIPLGARIMALVSAFEAMITKKPYRMARTIDDAITEIRANAGTQFDPAVVEVFLKVMKRKDIMGMLRHELYGEDGTA